MRQKTIFCLLIFVMLATPLTMAGTKEDIMRLQNDVLTLQNQIRDFDKKFDEKTDGLKSLVVQLIDQVAKSNKVLDQVSKALENQVSDRQSVNQTLLQEVRALSGKIDEAGTRISALAQQVADLKVQAKPLVQGGNSLGGPPGGSAYDQAYGDYVQGNFDLAIQEFTAYLTSSPGGEKAAIAQFYLGDAYSAQGKLPQAIAAFTRVINDYPGSDQVASALFKRGRAELAMRETDNAVADFKDIIGRFPASPEAEQAKTELRNLGNDPAKPAPAKETRRKSK
ncbi:MAG: tetratricopeptide repeat protein [Acidobacteriota bacterium]|jgi:tol-pal system protein YbgF